MKKHNHLGLALLAVIGFVFLPQSVRVAHAATVMLRVGTVQVAAGGTVDVPIEAVGAPGIGPLHLELTYDPAVLTAQEVTRGPLIANAMMEQSVSARGRVVIALVSADAIKGDGVVVKVRFKATGSQGQQSALTLDAVRAWERGNGRDVIVRTEAGRATVANDYVPLLWIAVACLLLLLLAGGGGLVLLWSRRNRVSGPQYAQPPYYAPPPYGPPPQAPPPNLPGRGRSGGPSRPADMPK
jgi:hypothetical protein